MKPLIFIDGAAGTTGLEIADRLQQRDDVALLTLDDQTRKDANARRDALNTADFAILCLPDEAAREAVAMVDPVGKSRLIDASSAHRVSNGWTYGFPEIIGVEQVANARFVSNPGCYPTGFIALLAPLIQAGLLPPNHPYTVHAVSGYSGGGKSLIERFEGDPKIAFRSYGLASGHKHIPEMQQYAGLSHTPIFSPAVIPTFRGMLVEIPIALGALNSETNPDNLRMALAEFYQASRVVRVEKEQPDEILLRSDAHPSDALQLYVCGSKDGGSLRLIARLDNLGKGASGAAVQSLNLMAGLPETTGLNLPA